jgi:hypothetical protein
MSEEQVKRIAISTEPHFIQWRAIYNDGTSLDALDAIDGYASIDRARIVSFILVKNNTPLVTIHLKPGQRLIWRKREFYHSNGTKDTVHLAGWQQTVKGQNVQSILYVFEDGRVEMAGAWDEEHGLYGAPILTENEAEENSWT